MATLSPAEIQALVNKHGTGMSDEDRRTFVAIAMAESGGRTDAVNKNSNGSTDTGLFQINSIHADRVKKFFPGGSLTDPETNVQAAMLVWADAGRKFTPWVAYKSGAYKKFLAQVPKQTDKEISDQTFQSDLQRVAGTDNPVTSAINSVNEQINKVASSAGAWIIAILFAVLGVVLILRVPTARLAKTAVGATGPGKIARKAGVL